MYSLPNFEPVHCSMSGSNCWLLNCIQVFQEAGKVVWYSHLIFWVVGKWCLLWPMCFLGKTLTAFVLLHFVLQGQTCILLQVVLDFLLFHFNPQWLKGHSFFFFFFPLEGIVIFIELIKFSFFGISGWVINLDCCNVEWLALEINWNHCVVFEGAPKYCILDSFDDSEGYSISSKGLKPTVVVVMVIWIEFTHFHPF